MDSKKNEEEIEKEKRHKAAKDFVTLTHVETRKQQVNKEKLAKLLEAQRELDEAKRESDILNQEDKIILSTFQKKRMMLDRIWIVYNQSQSAVGKPTIPRAELKEKLDRLVMLGFLTHEEIEYDRQVNDVYILTEKGEDEII